MIKSLFEAVSLHEKGIKEINLQNFEDLFIQIVENHTGTYKDYRKIISNFLSIFDENKVKSLSLLIFVFKKKYDELLSSPIIKDVDLSTLKTEYNHSDTKTFNEILRRIFSDGKICRISDVIRFIENDYSDEQKEKFSSLILDTFEVTSTKSQISADDVHNYILLLTIQRSLLQKKEIINAFHIINSGLVLDKIAVSEFNQTARDVAEELILASYKDSLPELGHFNSFRTYCSLNSFNTSLIYGIISMTLALKKPHITDIYIKAIIWATLKFFRNMGIDDLVKDIYKTIPTTISFDNYTTRAIKHTYFTSLLRKHDPLLPSLILDFFQEFREDIFNSGEHDALPWLNTLYNLKRLYPNADFSRNGLGFYLEVLEQIVPEQSSKFYKDMVDGDSTELKIKLKESIYKLSSTRNGSDYASDNTLAIQIASRLTPDAVLNEDYEGLLLAMFVKTDYSFIFKPKQSEEFMKLEIENFDENKFLKFFNDYEGITENLKEYDGSIFLWIISSEKDCYYLYFDSDYSVSSVGNWDYNLYNQLTKADHFSSFSFDDTKKSKGSIVEIFPEELLDDSNLEKKSFEFFKLNLPDANEIFVVLDMRISEFPHNLIQNKYGNFEYLNRPICNILSLEWFINYNRPRLDNVIRKSIWIPTEGGDFTINLLNSKLEETLKNNSFDIYTDLIIKKPLNAEINIVCSHGSNDISLTQMIFPNENPLLNLSTVIDQGKILIFFVCHSGSIKQTPFQNTISSLVKNYINRGYSAVIAPFWALHVNVPGIWLPKFLESLDDGHNVNFAVHLANLDVYKKYPHFAAWGCLHLYGDGSLKKN